MAPGWMLDACIGRRAKGKSLAGGNPGLAPQLRQCDRLAWPQRGSVADAQPKVVGRVERLLVLPEAHVEREVGRDEHLLALPELQFESREIGSASPAERVETPGVTALDLLLLLEVHEASLKPPKPLAAADTVDRLLPSAWQR